MTMIKKKKKDIDDDNDSGLFFSRHWWNSFEGRFADRPYVPMEEADIKVLVWRSMSFLARDHLQQHIFLFLLHFRWV